jgi:hypothetical protein
MASASLSVSRYLFFRKSENSQKEKEEKEIKRTKSRQQTRKQASPSQRIRRRRPAALSIREPLLIYRGPPGPSAAALNLVLVSSILRHPTQAAQSQSARASQPAAFAPALVYTFTLALRCAPAPATTGQFS